MLYLVSWLTDFTANQLVFAVPRRLAELGADPLRIGLAGTCYSAAATLCNPVSGHLSDRFGRRVVAVLGAVLLLASFVATLLLPPDHWSAIVAYSAGGAALGIIYPPVIAWLSHGRAGRSASRAFLIFCIAFNLGVICGQTAAGWLYERHGASGPLVLGMGAITLIVAAIALAPAAKSGSVAPGEVEATAARERVLSAGFSRVAWIANFGGMFSFSIVLYHLPRVAVNLGIPADQHGAMLAGSRLVVLATFFAMHFSTFWRHRLWTTLAIQLLACAGLVLLVFARNVAALTVGLVTLSLLTGSNYFASLYYTTTGAPEETKGRATGIHEATLAFGLAAGSVCGGVAGSHFGDRAPFWLAAAVVGALLLPQLAVYARRVRPLETE